MYNPNLKDPRVIQRIRSALGFARGVLSDTPHGWSSRHIDRHFGQQQHQLSQWLRQHLLICTDDRYNKDAGRTKQYKLNAIGADYITSILNTPTKQLVKSWAIDEFKPELESGNFNYKDQSNRLWHPLQNVRRIYKREILAEYNFAYHYDIQCAAPTLILQHAQKQPEPMDIFLVALNQYISNRIQIRNDLAHELEVDPKIIKVLINALFCGARIGNNPDFAISQLLNHDQARIEYLKQNEFIQQLRSDIKICWNYIAPSMYRTRVIDKNSRERLLPISSKQKWARYFDLERTILNSVVDYMKKNNYRYFLEHDGWSSSREIILNELELWVFNSTGYRVLFENE